SARWPARALEGHHRDRQAGGRRGASAVPDVRRRHHDRLRADPRARLQSGGSGMTQGTHPRSSEDVLPVAVVGGGPVGLITALGLVHYGVPVTVFEEDEQLSLDTKAGTILTRTLEILHRYG